MSTANKFVVEETEETHNAPLVGYNAEKAKLEGSNQSVTRPIPRLCSDIIPTVKGRNRKMTPRKMLNGINRYFAWCEETDSIPSIKGMMIHLKMYRNDFYRYMKHDYYTEMLEQARLVICNWAEEQVWSANGMVPGKIAYMKNVHSWAEKLDQNTNISDKRTVSVEEARSKIEMLAPLLMDVLKNANTVDQIAQPAEDAEYVDVKK